MCLRACVSEERGGKRGKEEGEAKRADRKRRGEERGKEEKERREQKKKREEREGTRVLTSSIIIPPHCGRSRPFDARPCYWQHLLSPRKFMAFCASSFSLWDYIKEPQQRLINIGTYILHLRCDSLSFVIVNYVVLRERENVGE